MSDHSPKLPLCKWRGTDFSESFPSMLSFPWNLSCACVWSWFLSPYGSNLCRDVQGGVIIPVLWEAWAENGEKWFKKWAVIVRHCGTSILEQIGMWVVGKFRSHAFPQAWERQNQLPLLFCFPSHFCWDAFAAPCPLLSGQEEPELALPCVFCMCGLIYGLPQPSLFGCLQPKTALPSLGSVPAFLPALTEWPELCLWSWHPSFLSLSAAHSQRPSCFFSLPFSGWLLANFNKGAVLTGLDVVSASIACFPLPISTFSLHLTVVCALLDFLVSSQPRNCPVQVSSLRSCSFFF